VGGKAAYFLSVSRMADKESRQRNLCPNLRCQSQKQVLWKQSGRTEKIILQSNGGISKKMIFNNLTNENFMAGNM
jgi:hypothetical protein